MKGKTVCLITFESFKPPNELLEMFSKAGVVWIVKEFGKLGAIGDITHPYSLRRSVSNSLLIHGRSDIATAAGI